MLRNYSFVRNDEMIGVLGHDSALYGYTGLGTTWANDMNFVMNHALGAGLIARTVDQQSMGAQKN